ncbi:MAG: esterase-like activity of phytase family protein, partial [Sphingomonadaceae bacterium]|nr:esterase-like activity of phytase family protein [Sphingomonadaceae bacterium]
MLRSFLALFVLLFTGSIVLLDPGRSEEAFGDQAIRAVAIPLDVAHPGADRIGSLRYLGGWVLSSDDPEFGGISGLAIGPDGFVAISDAGGVFRFELGADGRIVSASIATVPDGPEPENGGAPEKVDRDAEALFRDGETGQYWVAYEGNNMIWRYDANFNAAESSNAVAAMQDWPDNGGAEAMLRLADGRFVVFSEAGNGPRGSREALLFAADPSEADSQPLRFGYRPPGGYRITDAAELPDGRLIILNRRFSLVEGVSVIVTIASLDGLAEDAIIEGRSIARLDPPLTIDNMEAVVVAEENGRAVIWMASDDNFNPL